MKVYWQLPLPLLRKGWISSPSGEILCKERDLDSIHVFNFFFFIFILFICILWQFSDQRIIYLSIKFPNPLFRTVTHFFFFFCFLSLFVSKRNILDTRERYCLCKIYILTFPFFRRKFKWNSKGSKSLNLVNINIGKTWLKTNNF